MTEKEKVVSAEQSTDITSKTILSLRELVGDVQVKTETRLVLMIRKFWFRMVLYGKIDYDTPICFLGIGKDSLYQPYTNKLCVDLNEGEGIDVTMNIEDDLEGFFGLLKKRKIVVLVMEGVSTYLKPNTMRRLLKFIEDQKMKIVFTSTTKVLNDYLVRVGHVNKGIFQSSFEDYKDLLLVEDGEKKFNVISSATMFDFLGFKAERERKIEYFYIHNFFDERTTKKIFTFNK